MTGAVRIKRKERNKDEVKTLTSLNSLFSQPATVRAMHRLWLRLAGWHPAAFQFAQCHVQSVRLLCAKPAVDH